jgi:LemA protein
MGWILLAVVVVLAVWAIAIYNGLVTLRNRYKNAFSQIDVQLKRRYDLIPNLVETAKGYLKHERATPRSPRRRPPARTPATRRRCRASARPRAR